MVPIGQHPLVCRSVKGVFNERAPPVRVVPTWDIGKVLQCVSQWHPTSGISLQKLTWKVVFLLATRTEKCVSDLLFSWWTSICATLGIPPSSSRQHLAQR